ncbi:hypothetical protein [Aestuariirhabdus haliotis]|uniref:hypothetical protein n=1 Tax=Aestuariirhabdus haliotis TaxID=2918751 RepID=UPI0020BFD8AF|nr:hypothetical protein [Aestuariirhabdus haliotis]MCL6420330.1 hypothetical protein [Aestuariirhabdus haliotis]
MRKALREYAKSHNLRDPQTKIITQVIEQAMGGDTAAQKLLMERLVPPRKAVMPSVEFDVPKGAGPLDFATSVMDAVSGGKIPADVGSNLIAATANMMKIAEVMELQRRIEKLEGEQCLPPISSIG